jgi:hypothetical protein
MSCTFESGAECATGYGVLLFGSLNQVLNDDELGMMKPGRKGEQLLS